MILECLLLTTTLCHAFKDKPVFALTALHALTISADGWTTKQYMANHALGYEGDPVARAFVGRKPTNARMIASGTVLVLAEMYLTERMRTSRHKWARSIWWIPQTVTISIHISAIHANIKNNGIPLH